MKVAVLCNGPSRVDYLSSLEYDYVIGCNIPWTKVNATVVIDVNVLERWETPCPFYVSVDAWRELHKRQRFEPYFLGFVDKFQEHDSSGHAATRKVIDLGYKEVDIYGCDSWFTENTESYTHQWIDSRSLDSSEKVSIWRKRWNDIIDSNPDVNINFIGVSK